MATPPPEHFAPPDPDDDLLYNPPKCYFGGDGKPHAMCPEYGCRGIALVRVGPIMPAWHYPGLGQVERSIRFFRWACADRPDHGGEWFQPTDLVAE